MITLIGLGPANAGDLSVAARDALRAATNLLARTARHPAVDDLIREGIRFEALDPLYESGESFEAVYDAIARRVLEVAQQGDKRLKLLLTPEETRPPGRVTSSPAAP